MDQKLEQIAAAVGRDPDIADKLDELLNGPNDRAFVVCEYEDCKLNVNRQCTIYTVQNVPPMKTKRPCNGHKARSGKAELG